MTIQNYVAVIVLALMFAIPLWYATTSEACACGPTPASQEGIVVDGTVSERNWQYLIEKGWTGRDDGRIALHPPYRLSFDEIYNLSESISSGCGLDGKLHDDYSCTPYSGSAV